MPLQIVRNDITKMKVDAIVNAANSSLLGGGGVDGCIHRAAGPELLVECEKLNGCKTGSAKITKGYKLPCKYVIHAVGPRWYGGQYGEHDKLVSCYQTSLALAKEHGCESVAFPLISSGIFGYPKDEALKVAIDTISSFLLENDMMVYIVIFDRKAYQISSKLFADINAYIDDRYVEEHRDSYAERISRLHSLVVEESCPIPAAPMVTKAASLDDALKQIDESFSEMLLRKIDECGMTDAECYKKANIDRKLFSKIRSDKLYRPSKPTVIAFAIALELPLDELKDMFIVDALIGNFDRHGGNWGFIKKDNQYRIAPVYDNGSSLYPKLNTDEKLEAVLSSEEEIDQRIYKFPTSHIKVKNRKSSYFEVISSLQFEACNDALKRIVPRIDFNQINTLIDEVEGISEVRKRFYKVMLQQRYEKILMYAYRQL